jgi:hypothetical protein
MKIQHLSLIAVIVAIGLGGCKSTQAYPFCHCDNSDYTPELQAAISTSLNETMKIYSGNPDEYYVDVSSRALFYRATPSKHRELGRIWPRIGCLSSSENDTFLSRREKCILYLRALILSHQYDKLPDSKTGLWCY